MSNKSETQNQYINMNLFGIKHWMNYILNIKFKKFNTFKLLKIISYIMNNIVFNLLELIRK